MRLVRVMTLAAGVALLLLGLVRPGAPSGPIVRFVDLTPAAAGVSVGVTPDDLLGPR